MATFKLDGKYSATYSYGKDAKGHFVKGKIWKGHKATKIEFVGRGKTRAAAVNAGHAEAMRLCPTNDEE